MADKIDKSLDEIIKETKQTTRKGPINRRGGAQRGGGAVRGRFNNSNRGSSFPRRQGGGGAIQKRRSGANSLSPKKASTSINGKWNHDLYQNGHASAGAGAAGQSAGGPAKLIISNLDFGVNDSDIEGLFQEFGRLRKAAVHYDRSGRSLGTAEVFFERRGDAVRAQNHYNGVSLDGRPMNIELVGGSPKRPMPIARRSLGGGNPGPRRPMGQRRSMGGPRRQQQQQQKSSKSAADLDADLDAHNAKMQTD